MGLYKSSYGSWSNASGGTQWASITGGIQTVLLDSVSNPGPTDKLRLSAFGFAIPSIAEITKILLVLDVRADNAQLSGPYGGTIQDALVKFQIGGVETTDLVAGNQVTVAGGQGSVQAAQWIYQAVDTYTIANVNDATWGVDLEVQCPDGTTCFDLMATSQIWVYTKGTHRASGGIS